MAQLRLPSARLVFDLPPHDALVGKDAVCPCNSLALPPPTPGLIKYFLMVEFKAPNYLMILIPAKMNSPDYDDIIDMFNVRTPISPLPPTPVASQSHEQSQDAI
ncbi:hypothetical protein TNCV_2748981 [Trichonephila clavipes]|nr:hypothetical protein TNCV_2748981 [Trichonephila clavipes]